MTKHLIGLLTLLTTTAGAAEIVGLAVPPYPEGLTETSGACIGPSLGLEKECDYSIGGYLLAIAEQPTAGVRCRNEAAGL